MKIAFGTAITRTQEIVTRRAGIKYTGARFCFYYRLLNRNNVRKSI